jgi:hypothetical protein
MEEPLKQSDKKVTIFITSPFLFVTFLSDCLRGSSILIRLERNGEVMKIVTFLSDCLRGSSILIRLKRNGEVMKIVTFLSDCLRGSQSDKKSHDFHHLTVPLKSDQNGGTSQTVR